RVAAVARMAPQAALDQHIDLALEQLVQARWLADAGSDLGLGPAELREPPPQIVDVDAAMYPDMQQARDALGLEFGGRLGNTTKRLTYRGQIGFPGGGQDHLPRQSLEQLHAQPLLQQANLLADRACGDVQLVRGLLEAEVASRRLEGAQGVEGRQQVSHGWLRGVRAASMHEACSRDKGEILLCRRRSQSVRMGSFRTRQGLCRPKCPPSRLRIPGSAFSPRSLSVHWAALACGLWPLHCRQCRRISACNAPGLPCPTRSL